MAVLNNRSEKTKLENIPLKPFLHELNSKIPWGFISVALALVFGFLAIYQAFFQQKRPAISIEILSNTSILDVKEDVAGLDIQYDRRDIRKANESLRVITVRVENTGKEDILKSFYDSRDPFGIKISKGKLIEEPTILAASSDYIRKNLDPKIKDDNVIQFSDIILEVGQYFVIKLLLLHKRDGSPPTIEKAVGTIAGLQTPTILEMPGEKPKKSLWAQAFSGSYLVQVIRFICYFFGMIFAMIFIIAPPAIISDALSKRRRKRTIEDYKLGTDIDLNEKDNFLLKRYIEYGSTYVLRIERLFDNSDLLNSLCRKVNEKSKEMGSSVVTERDDILAARLEDRVMDRSIIMGDRVLVRALLKNEYILKKSNDKYEVDDHAKQLLEDFGNYLRKRKLISLKESFDHSSIEMIQ